MGESTSATPVPAWAWMIAGVVIGGLAMALTAQTPEPTTPSVDSEALKAQQKQLQILTKRLKRLETRPALPPARRIAQKPSPAQIDPPPRKASKVGAEGRPSQGVEEFAAADEPRQGSTKVWTPPVFEDGHRFDDGVVVDMKPDYPAAADPIPASAQTSQDGAAELKAAFPKGCPTCE